MIDSDYRQVSSVLKTYPDFARLYEYTTPVRVLRKGKRYARKKAIIVPDNIISTELAIAEMSSLRRTKTAISDLTLANEFDMFGTFTFNCSNCNQGCKNSPCVCDSSCLRLNPIYCKKTMVKWLKRQSLINKSMYYLIVPEWHKKGGLHFHALLKGYEGNLISTNHLIKGRKIYNIPSYKSGFSTVAKIDNVAAVSSYVRKYITKEMPQFPGKKRYWCSLGLKRPIKVSNPTGVHLDKLLLSEVYSFQNLTISQAPVTI